MAEADAIASNLSDGFAGVSLSTVLVEDVWLQIISYLSSYSHSLSQIALVNRAFSRLVPQYLYRHVVWYPPHTNQLDLKATGLPKIPSLIHSARLSHNAPHVKSLTIGGYLSAKPHHARKIVDYALGLVRAFVNIRSLTLSVYAGPESLSDEVVAEIISSPPNNLFRITIYDSAGSTRLLQNIECLPTIRALTLKSPSRATLNTLLHVIELLGPRLEELHLEDNCGSITPGVLRDIEPHITDLKAFSFGLSYSITDTFLADFLEKLPNLETLSLQYYYQGPTGLFPKKGGRLTRLKSFTAYYGLINEREDAIHLAKWVQRLVRNGPLERLHLVEEDVTEWPLGELAFEGLWRSLLARHATTLRVLEAPGAMVNTNVVRQVFTKFERLDTIEIGINIGGVKILIANGEIPRSLHTVKLWIRHSKHIVPGIEEEVMRSGPGVRLVKLWGGEDVFEVGFCLGTLTR
ncbi:hypothetical protein CYLTODRAFT_397183 [Cylindrobasidium torrendii FP15055 ss-10]|uniref:F-box domain-containing protein n=1 Tax=Cylindrobasidium torrendii FP15055 ss-10 TaxID=1314674 RepID=A0A0D7BAW9_9AGAR|nr:hypothetical protein CYLTODRAFT_397183 [Cylindrobasidium torrendii FP15055 ss-10]